MSEGHKTSIQQHVIFQEKFKEYLKKIDLFIQTRPYELQIIRSIQPTPELVPLHKRIWLATEEEIRRPRVDKIRAYCTAVEQFNKADPKLTLNPSQDSADLEELHAVALETINYYLRLDFDTKQVLKLAPAKQEPSQSQMPLQITSPEPPFLEHASSKHASLEHSSPEHVSPKKPSPEHPSPEHPLSTETGHIILTTDKLCKDFNAGGQEHRILKDLNIDIYENDFTVIMGSSGAGKSTLLYSLSGMDRPTGGIVRFFDEDIAKLSNDKLAVFRRRNCGFIFQHIFMLDNMSILDNILTTGLLVSRNRKPILEYAEELLEKVGLSESTWRKFPSQLSGGENQRAAIVRALINKPKVVFADEPTGALNSASGEAVLNVLTDINRGGQSIVMVTHDLKSAWRGNRVLYISDGNVCGECSLGKYSGTDQRRQDKLRAFLNERGW